MPLPSSMLALINAAVEGPRRILAILIGALLLVYLPGVGPVIRSAFTAAFASDRGLTTAEKRAGSFASVMIVCAILGFVVPKLLTGANSVAAL